MRLYNPKSEMIALSLAKKVFQEVSPYTIFSILYFQGEPLLNREFPQIVRLARKNNLLTSTSTNAQLIDSQMAKKLVLSGLDRIIISLDGTTQETYEQYRVGGKLEKAIQSIEHLQHWKKELKKPHPFIEIQFLVLKSNEHQIDDVKAL
ncbi:MAG: radical SAM protein, partial [Paludibacter sp.]